MAGTLAEAPGGPPARPLVTVPEVASLLGISQSEAYRWLERGDLPGAVKLGGRWYVRRRVLEVFLSEQAPGSGAPAADATPTLHAVR